MFSSPAKPFDRFFPVLFNPQPMRIQQPQSQLAIGDALITDLKGAKGAGLAALFIADGLHGEEIEPYTPEHLNEMFDAAQVEAKAAMRALKW